MFLYKSVYEYAEAEYVVEKSRFIAHASPVSSTEEAKLFIAEIKEKYKDATHNVPAFICGAGMEHEWASDDGEPSGTSGMPVLKLMESEGLTNVCIVVTRYFGGIKLGTGGLARAYTQAAKLAIEKAGICEVRESALMIFELDYTYMGKLQNLAQEGRFIISDTEYTDKVRVSIECPSEEADGVKSLIADLTGGKASLTEESSREGKYPVKQDK